MRIHVPHRGRRSRAVCRSCAAALICLLAVPAAYADDPTESVAAEAPTVAAEADATEPAPPAEPRSFVDAITVTSTSTPRSIEETAGSVGVISRQQIEQLLTSDARELLVFEPGVYVEGQPSRLGLGGFNIRGVGGNRVATRIDGVPTPEQFAFGPLAIQRSTLDVDELETVEILRSAGSSLYGSDALGGVVSLVTRDPGDYLAEGSPYVGARLGWDGRSDESSVSLTGAYGEGAWSAALSVSHRDGGAADNQGEIETEDASRTAPNPYDLSSTGILGKLVYDASSHWRLRLGVETQRSSTEGEIFSSRTVQNFGPMFGPGVTYRIATDQFDVVDEFERDRISLEAFGSRVTALSDSLLARIYHLDSRGDQNVLERVVTTLGGGPFGPVTSSAAVRDGLFRFDQEMWGAELQAKKGLARGRHLITYGAAWSRDEFDQLRDRVDTDPATGQVLPSSAAYPTKYFPASRVDELGIYVQDELELFGGRLRMVPGVRYDRASLDATKNDRIYLEGNPGSPQPADAVHDAISPRLGAVVALTDSWSLFTQYARGFRTPPYSDVNTGFSNVTAGYKALPNPDLDPETSDNLELGVRGSFARGGLSVTLFDNRYDDFIEMIAIGEDPADGLLLYQTRNLHSARIRGIELAGEARLGKQWRLRSAATWMEGDNDEIDQPLNSVPPSRIVLGAAWMPAGRWSAALVTTHLFAKRESELDRTTVDQFATPSAWLVDATAAVHLTDAISLEAGLFNLLDETYWEWGDVQGLAAGSPVLDRYSSPGRNVAATLRLHW